MATEDEPPTASPVAADNPPRVPCTTHWRMAARIYGSRGNPGDTAVRIEPDTHVGDEPPDAERVAPEAACEPC